MTKKDEKGLEESWDKESWRCIHKWKKDGECNETHEECSIGNCPRSIGDFMEQDLWLLTTDGDCLTVSMELDKFENEYILNINDTNSEIEKRNYTIKNPVILSERIKDRDTAIKVYEILSDLIKKIRERNGKLHLDYMNQRKMKTCPECHGWEDSCDLCNGLGLINYKTYKEEMEKKNEKEVQDRET